MRPQDLAGIRLDGGTTFLIELRPMHISCGLSFRRTMLDIRLFLCVVNLLKAMLLAVLCRCRTRIRPVMAVVT